MNKITLTLSFATAFAFAGAAAVRAQTAFIPGDLVVYRVGDGSETLANTGNSVFLDEYSVTGALVRSIPMNNGTSGVGSNFLVASGTATSEGLLTLSANGQYLALAGYNTSPGGTGASLATSAAATVNRTVNILGAAGRVLSSTALTDFADGNNPRSAVPTDTGTAFYGNGGAGGIHYATAGSTTSTQLSTTGVNLRGVTIAGGQLYVSSQAGGTGSFGVGAVGTGIPTTSGQTITGLTGLPAQSSTFKPNQFAFADVTAAVPGVDTLYVADEAGTGTIDKFSLVSGSWTAEGAIAAANVRGLTLKILGGTVNLYGTTGGSTATGGGSLYGFADITGFAGTVSGTATTLATAGANEAFRGVAFAPVAAPEPSTWALLGIGATGLFGVSRRRVRIA